MILVNIANAIIIAFTNTLSIVLADPFWKLVWRFAYIMNYLDIHFINGLCHAYFVKVQVQIKAE